MAKLFQIMNIPFLLAVLLSIVSWSITSLINRLWDTPFIEYKTTYNVKEEKFDIENITRKFMFKNIHFLIKVNDKGICRKCKIIKQEFKNISPMSINRENTEPVKKTDYEVVYHITELHPGWKFEIKLEIQNCNENDISLYFYTDVKENKPIYLTKSGMYTFIIKNEIFILALLNILLIIIILSYFFSIHRHEVSE